MQVTTKQSVYLPGEPPPLESRDTGAKSVVPYAGMIPIRFSGSCFATKAISAQVLMGTPTSHFDCRRAAKFHQFVQRVDILTESVRCSVVVDRHISTTVKLQNLLQLFRWLHVLHHLPLARRCLIR